MTKCFDLLNIKLVCFRKSIFKALLTPTIGLRFYNTYINAFFNPLLNFFKYMTGLNIIFTLSKNIENFLLTTQRMKCALMSHALRDFSYEFNNKLFLNEVFYLLSLALY